MRKKVLSLTLALVMALSLVACGGEEAPSTGGDETNKEPVATEGRTEVLTLRLGALGSGRPEDIQSYPINAFIDYVEEKTDGMIQIEYFPDGQLGQEGDMLDQILTDDLDIGVLSANVLGTIWEEMYVYNLPFAFSTYEQMWEAVGVNSEFVKIMRGVVDETGLAKFVTSFSAEFRGIHNNVRPLRTPKDFEGVTFRVMSGQVFTDMFQALGSSTATIAFSELYTALEQGAVQGEDLGASMHLDYSFEEVCPYSTEFNLTPTVNCLMFSNGAWDKLTEEEIQIINEAAAVAEQASYEYVHTAAEDQYARLEAAGSDVVRYADLTEAELAACWDAVKPLWDKYEDIVGTDLYNIMLENCPYYN